ncbi:Gag-Pol polyprotein [Cyphomyrmex costatus]|uniref:Gag-Pol polyprotein n=1 Tax=Cyphomyrmex costatus TaxID=456900 RepID=A0A151IGL1_9HYME|nr:Gag-Pol polyprotein [Cyphomyrmex costatus]
MYRLPSYTSIFSAEAYAIYNAVMIAIDMNLQNVTIVSDSKSVLQSLNGHLNPTNNYLIPLIKSVLEKAQSKGTNIQFIWVPSHSGITGNEKADQLAKRAIRKGIEPNFKVPYSDICAIIKHKISENFYQHLISLADFKGSYFFSHIFKRTAKPWYFRLKISRDAIVMTNRLRSDHYNLNHSLFRKNLTENPSCPCGDPKQDILHLIYECPYSRDAARFLRRLIDRVATDNDNLKKFSQVIAKPTAKLCRLILSFSKACGRQF